MRIRAVALGALLAAAIGCGGSPSQPAPVTPPPSAPVTPVPVPPAPPAPPTLGVTRILAFGDSMTEGTTSPAPGLWAFRLDAGRPQSYPAKLQTLITARYSAQTVQVFNAGSAGRRASEDRDRFARAVSEAQPGVILLLEGANDLNAPLDPGEGINDRIRLTVGSLEDMVKDAGFRQIPIMIGTLPPQRTGAPKAGAAPFLGRFNDAVKTMAGLKGAQLIDVNAQLTLADIGADGLHLTEAGYQHLAQVWLDALKARFEAAPAGS